MSDHLVIVMPYDKASFIAGIAAGRNMRSWPILEEAETGYFSWTIDMAKAGSSAGLSYRFDGTILEAVIYWGDDTETNVYAGNAEWFWRHTYSDVGIYHIKVVGKIRKIQIGAPEGSSGYESYTRAVISVDSPFPPLPSEIARPARVNLNSLFAYCYNLKTIPWGLFANYAEEEVYISNMSRLFYHCSSLRDLPIGLFSNLKFNTASQNLYSISYMFYNCTSLGGLPFDLFTNPALSVVGDAEFLFANAKAEFPSRCMSGLTGLVTVSYMFYSFGDSSDLWEVPSGFIPESSAMLDASGMFYNSKIKRVPSSIFDDAPNISTFVNCFRDCAYLEHAPAIWESHASANGSRCFFGTVQVDNYADIPSSWK